MKKRILQMKWTKRIVLIALLLGVAGLGKMFAQSFTVGDLNYQVNYGGVSVTVTGHINGTSATGSLVIPETVEYDGSTYSVTTIGGYAFRGCSGLTGSLTIGNSVITIGYRAFYNCSGFTGSLTIPNSVTSIGSYAFSGCSGFTGSLTIPNSVTTIGEGAFSSCSGFSGSLTIPNSVTTIGEGAFSSCSGFTGSLTIPNSVTTIGQNAFGYCSGLEAVYYEGNINQWCNIQFGDYYSNPLVYAHNLFIDNELVTDLMIPETVTEINPYTFCGATCLISLSIPNSVTTIGESAFDSCSGFTGSLIIPNSVISIGDWAFLGCSGFMGNLTIGNSVTTIGESAFDSCSGFTGSLIIPNSVITIGNFAFFECSGFTGSLTIPNSVTEIGEWTFFGCSGFTSMTILAETPPILGSDAFYDVNKSIPVYVPFGTVSAYQAASGWNEFTNIQEYGPCPISFADANVKAICVANWDTNGDGELSYAEAAAVTDLGQVFRENTEITSFEELQYFIGLTSISSYAFYNCSNLSGSLYIPNSVTTIGDYAFIGCSGFTGSLNIPNSVTTIGVSAFRGCSGFTGSLTIPNSVTTISNYAFYGCSGFTGSLTIPNSVTTISNYAFYGCSGFTGSLTIPNSVTTIGNEAFSGCSGFTGSLTIPNSVISIESGAFSNCSGFTGNLTIGNSVTTIGYAAFFYCSGFTGNLTIGNSVTTIDRWAFYVCSGFTGSLTIGNSVTTIGESAFNRCSGFTGNLTIPNSVTTIGSSAFYNCSGFNGSLTIGNSVTTIGGSAFYNCSGFMGELVIPNSVTTIGGSAFSSCSGFTGELVIPNSVTTIGSGAFVNCSLFSSLISYAETPPTLGNDVFTAFGLLAYDTPAYVPCGFEETYSSLSWGNFHNFYGLCGGVVVVSANIENGGMVTGGGMYEQGQPCTVTATANEGYYFVGWMKNGVLTSRDSEYTFFVSGEMDLLALFVPDGIIVFSDANVKSICVSHWDTNGDGELSYAEAAAVTGLGQLFSGNTEIALFEELQYFIGLTHIKSNTFNGCSNVSLLSLPNYVNSIGAFAFSGCSSIVSITIPESLSIVGSAAFYGCNSLSSVYYTGNVAQWCRINFYSLGNPLYYAHNLYIDNTLVTDLVIPEETTEIKSGNFSGATCLTSIDFGNSVTTIGQNAFSGCSGIIGTLTIPNSVTTIGNNVFQGCSGLNEIMMFGVTPPSLGYSPFNNTNNCPIYVPYESLNNYKTATNWSNYEDRIFPMSYTTIPGYGEGEGNYRFIASPLVENTTPTAVDNMITETAYDLYRFDQSENDEWQNYKYPENTPNFFLTNGQGYLYANAEDVNLIFKGAFNEDDTKEVGLAYDATATFAGWNLVGNPFPVDAYANKSYYTMNEEGTAIEPNMVSSATAIPVCTGVMVMAEAEGETVVFSTEAPEAATNQGCLQIELSQAVELVETPIYRGDGPSTGSGTLHDKAIVSFNAGDRLEKFVFNKENAVISIPQGGKELAIACSNKQGEMPLNFKASKNGEYTLTIHPEAVELDYLHLIDNLTGADVDLLALRQAQGPANYTFEAKTTDYASRFRLVFSGNEAGDPSTGSETFAFVNNGNIIITGAEVGATLQIVDMTGHVVASCGGHTRCVPTTGMAKGVYVLRLINGDDVKTQKIVIR